MHFSCPLRTSLQGWTGSNVMCWCAGMWYYLSTFYSEKDIGMAYSWVITGTALSQVHTCLQQINNNFTNSGACHEYI